MDISSDISVLHSMLAQGADFRGHLSRKRDIKTKHEEENDMSTLDEMEMPTLTFDPTPEPEEKAQVEFRYRKKKQNWMTAC